MPYYYLLPEVPDEPTEVKYNNFRYKKPIAYNLLLPSIHSSRDDNVLLTETDAPGAVAALLTSCRDSDSWPSSAFRAGCKNQEDCSANVNANPYSCNSRGSGVCDVKSSVGHLKKSVKLPMYDKERSPFSTYDASDPHVLNAAMSLFFERKRQQALYAAFPSWHNPTGAPRIPTDYELFVAWASLSRADKMSYISEVNGKHGSDHLPYNTLETQRAVNALYGSSADAVSWPSFQYSRAVAQPPCPRRPLPPPPLLPPPRLNPKLFKLTIPHIGVGFK